LGPDLALPDFWLNEATNVLWLQVHRKRLAANEAQEALGMLQALPEPTATAAMRLHDTALEIGTTLDHSPQDTLYLAFAFAIGARAVIVADPAFARAVRSHPDRDLATMVTPLDRWAAHKGLSA